MWESNSQSLAIWCIFKANRFAVVAVLDAAVENEPSSSLHSIMCMVCSRINKSGM